jgi:polysaccharide export outer membrane protein
MPCQRIAGLPDYTAQPIVGLTVLALLMMAAPAFGSPQPAEPAQSVTGATPGAIPGATPGAINQPLSPSATRPPGRSNPLLNPSSNPPPSPPPNLPDSPYTLGAGDRIRIDIFQVPQYSGETDVLIDGALNLPLVGRVQVKGLSLDDATNKISNAYSRYLRRPIVTLTLLQRRPVQIGISGEVIRPGTYTIATTTTSGDSSNSGEYPTLTQLLEKAGGITQVADVHQVQVRRRQRSGAEQIYTVDLWQLLQTGDLSYNVTLRDGDTIVIPRRTADLAEAPLLATTSFSADQNRPINIAVVGEVFRPGSYSVTGGIARTQQAGVPGDVQLSSSLPTVTRAIQVAGGIKPLADIRHVTVRRLQRDATVQEFQVDLWAFLQAGNIQQDAILQEGDTIVVPSVPELNPAEASQLASASFAPDKIKVNVVGEVKNAGPVELPPNTPLNQAILTAGGFNTRARQGSVELIRLNPDGTVTRRRVRIDLDNNLNEQSNPALYNNDVVIVNRSGLAAIGDTLGSILNPLEGAFSILSIPFRFLNLFN